MGAIMIEEFFIPLERQIDSGFGATANTFHEAAKAIDTEEFEFEFGFGLNQSRLPVFYLYRHANELYLKSIITILHRRFSVHYSDNKKDDFPFITVNGKDKKIFAVHSIQDLYNEFRRILAKHANVIKERGKFDWSEVPEGLDDFVKLIDKADEASTMFRYPITLDPENDKKKSSFKDIHPDDAIAQTHIQTGSGKLIFALKNKNNEITKAFIHDSNPVYEVFEALKKLSDILIGVQLVMLEDFVSNRE